jgi:hypothetical protein
VNSWSLTPLSVFPWSWLYFTSPVTDSMFPFIVPDVESSKTWSRSSIPQTLSKHEVLYQEWHQKWYLHEKGCMNITPLTVYMWFQVFLKCLVAYEYEQAHDSIVAMVTTLGNISHASNNTIDTISKKCRTKS